MLNINQSSIRSSLIFSQINQYYYYSQVGWMEKGVTTDFSFPLISPNQPETRFYRAYSTACLNYISYFSLTVVNWTTLKLNKLLSSNLFINLAFILWSEMNYGTHSIAIISINACWFLLIAAYSSHQGILPLKCLCSHSNHTRTATMLSQWSVFYKVCFPKRPLLMVIYSLLMLNRAIWLLLLSLA